MPFGLGFGEMMIILVIVMVVFGGKKLPQLGDGLGKSIRNFKRALGAGDEEEKSPDVTPTPTKPKDGDQPGPS